MTALKKQHTITAAYLRGFANSETPNSLWQYRKLDGKSERRNVGSATVRHFAFSYKNANGDYDHEIELLWQKIEGEAIPILKALLNGKTLDLREKTDLALLFATFVKRQSLMLDTFSQAMDMYSADKELLIRHVDELLAQNDTTYTVAERETIRARLRSGDLGPDLEAARRANMVGSLNYFRQAASIIAGMEWQIWTAKDGFFLTSDSPVFVRRNGHFDDPGIVGLNRADLRAELYAPLSRRKFLIAKHEPCNPSMIATKSRVKELNALVTRMGYRNVFAECDSMAISNLVRVNSQFTPPTINLPNFFAKWGGDMGADDKRRRNPAT